MVLMFLWMLRWTFRRALRGTRTSLRLRRRPGLSLRRFAARLNWRGLPGRRSLSLLRGLAELRGLARLRGLAELRGLAWRRCLAGLRGLARRRRLAGLWGLAWRRELASRSSEGSIRCSFPVWSRRSIGRSFRNRARPALTGLR